MWARAVAALAAVSLLPEPAPAAAAAADPPPPPVLLEDGWETSRDAVAWRPVRVPSVLEPAPLERHFSGTVAWYDGRRKPAWRYARRWFGAVPLFRRPAAGAAGG